MGVLELVSPARAGMVPIRHAARPRRACFPRASGDGPASASGAVTQLQFPPRERGWSHKAPPPPKNYGVSPARAGMVPRPAHYSADHQRFPRASGDGPQLFAEAVVRLQFPPRERGWSRAGRSERIDHRVSPARAGMVPQGGAGAAACRSFPRASGDGPSQHRSRRPKRWFPPRERGWSLGVVVLLERAHVSPARAGMVPRLPVAAHVMFGFPRASGDGPLSERIATLYKKFPPRERGWSLRRESCAGHGRVSPARAGMVPKANERSIDMAGFPRASGDGPSSSSTLLIPYAFPPRERGWSLHRLDRHVPVVVSPARAGMVPGICRQR